MLSSDNMFPIKSGRSASIWSLDSGYASGLVEDDELERDSPRCTDAHDVTPIGLHHPSSSLPFGPKITGLWNIHVDDQLRIQRKEPVIEPSTTRLNVYTAREQINHCYSPPQSTGPQTCITCDLWDITNPGENIKCQKCLELESVKLAPTTVHTTPTRSNILAPRLQIPEETFNHQLSPTATRCVCESPTPGKPSCKKCTASIGLLSPVSPATSEIRRSRAGRSSKLSAAALERLQSWLDANRDHPYPTSEEKAALAQECGITVKQVCTWFTNTRARHLKAPDDNRSPRIEYEENHASGGSTPGDSSFYSSENANDHIITTPSRSPVIDNGHAQLQSSRRGRKKDYRRNNGTSPAAMISPAQHSRCKSNTEINDTTWQCTFCRQSLAPKSWRRHEETQHRPKYTWICLASGPIVIPSSRRSSSPVCVLCGLHNPTVDHCNNAHRMLECAHKTEDERTFLRPDHLRQHVKNFHKTTLSEKVRDMWRRDGPGKNTEEGWQCGFCDESLQTWDIRETHIAGHFKDGLTMADWKASATNSPNAIETEAAANAHSVPEFDFGPLPDINDSLEEWDLNFGSSNDLSFGEPSVSDPSTQHLVADNSYGIFQDQGPVETNFNIWSGNPIDYHGPW